jgi:large subunit ribosomal protein L22
VLDTIKGMRVEQALNTVHFSTKRMAPVIEKVLRSAIQNATYVSQEQGLDVDVDNLYVRTAVANEGPAHEAYPALLRWAGRSATSAGSRTSS